MLPTEQALTQPIRGRGAKTALPSPSSLNNPYLGHSLLGFQLYSLLPIQSPSCIVPTISNIVLLLYRPPTVQSSYCRVLLLPYGPPIIVRSPYFLSLRFLSNLSFSPLLVPSQPLASKLLRINGWNSHIYIIIPLCKSFSVLKKKNRSGPKKN